MGKSVRELKLEMSHREFLGWVYILGERDKAFDDSKANDTDRPVPMGEPKRPLSEVQKKLVTSQAKSLWQQRLGMRSDGTPDPRVIRRK